jgi:hypothetical protein
LVRCILAKTGVKFSVRNDLLKLMVALLLAMFWQSGSLFVPYSEWVYPMTAVQRPSSQGEGAGVPLRSWKRTARRRLASLGLDLDNSFAANAPLSPSVLLCASLVLEDFVDFS